MTLFGTKLVNFYSGLRLARTESVGQFRLDLKGIAIRFIGLMEFNVSAAVIDKISNFPLNSTRMQQAHYFCDIHY